MAKDQLLSGAPNAELRLWRITGSEPSWFRTVSPGSGIVAMARGSAFSGGEHLVDQGLANRVAEAAAGLDPSAEREALDVLLRTLNGSWAFAVLWPDGRLCAAVDRLQTIRLFYGRTIRGTLVIAAGVDQLLDCADAGLCDDDAAVEMLLSGYVIGPRTLRRGIKQLQAGEVLHGAAGSVTFSRYYRFLRDRPNTDAPEILTDHLDDVMNRVFARWVETHANEQIVVPLSGGLDSRLVLAMMKLHGHPNLLAMHYGSPGSVDSNTSRAVAQALGVPWKFYPYDEGDWQPLMATTRAKTFWRFASQDAVLPHVQDYLALHKLYQQEPGFEGVFFPGMVGDMIAGAWVPAHFADGAASVDIAAIRRHLLEGKYTNWVALSRDRTHIGNEILDFFRQAPLNETHDSAGAHDLFEFENRQARYIANSVRSFEFYGSRWRLPLCDHLMMDFFLSIPTELRNMKRLYALWMRDRVFVGPFADLANIPPVGEGRWVWYNEPRKDLPGRGSWNVVARHAAKAVYRRSMPRRVRIARTKQNELRYATPPLRFNEWFATTDAESRHLTVSDLMAPPGGILSASAPAIAERLALMADQRLCLAPPLGLLAAAYLADFNRRIGEQR